MHGEPVVVETDLFEHRKVGPHFINSCCFGEDFAVWLKRELLRFPELRMGFSEPNQEDHGWGFWGSQGRDRYWIAISYAGDGPQETPAQWVIPVSYDPGFKLAMRLLHKPSRRTLEQLRDRVRQVLGSSGTIRLVKT